MKVLLKTDVKALGRAGEVVTVSDGYARNYLFPRNLATAAGASAAKAAEQFRQAGKAREARLGEKARELAARLQGVTCTISSPADPAGHLYGSVTDREIADAISAAGVEVDRRQIQLDEHIKSLGDFRVPVRIPGGEPVEVSVRIVGID